MKSPGLCLVDRGKFFTRMSFMVFESCDCGTLVYVLGSPDTLIIRRTRVVPTEIYIVAYWAMKGTD